MTSKKRALKRLSQIFMSLSSEKECQDFLEDFLSPSEILQFEERWAIVEALLEGKTQRKIAEDLGVSISKVTRGSQAIQFGKGSFTRAYDALK